MQYTHGRKTRGTRVLAFTRTQTLTRTHAHTHAYSCTTRLLWTSANATGVLSKVCVFFCPTDPSSPRVHMREQNVTRARAPSLSACKSISPPHTHTHSKPARARVVGLVGDMHAYYTEVLRRNIYYTTDCVHKDMMNVNDSGVVLCCCCWLNG